MLGVEKERIMTNRVRTYELRRAPASWALNTHRPTIGAHTNVHLTCLGPNYFRMGIATADHENIQGPRGKMLAVIEEIWDAQIQVQEQRCSDGLLVCVKNKYKWAHA